MAIQDAADETLSMKLATALGKFVGHNFVLAASWLLLGLISSVAWSLVIVPTFHLAPLSVAQGLGVVLVVGIVMPRSAPDLGGEGSSVVIREMGARLGNAAFLLGWAYLLSFFL